MEQEDKKSVTIKILDNEYTIKGSSSPSHLKKAANYADGIMKKILQNNRHMSKDKLAILASINLADEVLKLKEEVQKQSYMQNIQTKKEQLRERHREEQNNREER